MQVSRLVLLIMVGLIFHNILFIAEQLASSLFELHPRWAHLSDLLRDNIWRLHMWMQPYGGTSPKATLLYSNCSAVIDLWKKRDPNDKTVVQTTVSYVDSSGQPRVKGGADLKSTQAYPERFGAAIGGILANLHAVQRFAAGTPLSRVSELLPDTDEWADANLDAVLQDLQSLPA